jgi:hypothetical protein
MCVEVVLNLGEHGARHGDMATADCRLLRAEERRLAGRSAADPIYALGFTAAAVVSKATRAGFAVN